MSGTFVWSEVLPCWGQFSPAHHSTICISAADDPSDSQSVITITKKAPTSDQGLLLVESAYFHILDSIKTVGINSQ